MNCERIKELILTDYSDGQMSAQGKLKVDNHLMHCLACRTLAEKVKQEALFPFDNKKAAAPDPFVWRRIQSEIEKGTVPEHARVGTMDILANFLGSFKPAVAVAALFFVLMIAPIVNYHVSQHPSYLAYVMDGDNEAGDDVTAGIEEYFL